MTYSDFLKLVREMRAAQTAYFKSRKTEDLGLARALEYKVDRAIAERGQSSLIE